MDDSKDTANGQIREANGQFGVGWKTYVDAQINAVVNTANAKNENVDDRLKHMNEFRAALSDQATHFITRTEHDFLDQQVRDLKDVSVTRSEYSGVCKDIQTIRDTLVPRVEYTASVKDIQNLKDIIVPRVEHTAEVKDIQVIKEELAVTRGKASQNSVNVATILAVLGIIIGMGSILVRVLVK